MKSFWFRVIFPVVMHECESWTIKKAECQRIAASKFWCRRRHFRVPWPVKISNQSMLKEINSKYLLEGLMRKLKLQYFGHLMGRGDSLEKTLMLGKTEGRRRRQRRMKWLDSITNSMDVSLSKLREIAQVRCVAIHGITKITRLSNWTATTTKSINLYPYENREGTERHTGKRQWENRVAEVWL